MPCAITKDLALSEVIFLKPTIYQNTEGQNEYAIAAMEMILGVEGDQIGYVSREYLPFRGLYENKLVQITKFYSNSSNEYEKLLSKSRKGIALCKVIS